MKIVFDDKNRNENVSLIKEISNCCGITYDTARLLSYRNIDSVKKANEFLNPSKKDFNSPKLFNDMDIAVSRIEKAKENRESVLVFGDYDVDGICATTILSKCLCEYGIKVLTEIPEREDNYGMNLSLIEKIEKENKIDLIISVDCGVSDKEKIDVLLSRGIDVIVTDHHEPPEELPNCVVINPKLKNQKYPFDGLCGAGVAYKLGYAIIGEKADKYLDYVALATVADSMPLIGENRSLVSEGLKLFNLPTIRKEFSLLIGDNNKKITAQSLAYLVAPRINAGGRMGDAHLPLKMFLSNDENEMFDIAVKLNEYNILRQADCESMIVSAEEKISKYNLNKEDVVLVYNKNWSEGSRGIVAAKLAEKYGKPTIVFSEKDGVLKGSARSIDDFNIFDAINVSKDFLISFGGHAQAAGVTLYKTDFNKFSDNIYNFALKNKSKLKEEKEILVAWNCTSQFDINFAKEIDLLEPFGVGNPKPLFSCEVEEVISKNLRVGSPHYTFNTSIAEMLDFNGEKDVFTLSLPIKKHIIFEPNVSFFNNKEYLKGYVKNVVCNIDYSLPQLKPYFLSEYAKKGTELKDEFFKTLLTDREIFADLYQTFKSKSGKQYTNSVAFCKGIKNDYGLFETVFCLEVFLELNFFFVANGVFKVNAGIKNPLTKSELYLKVCKIKGEI